MNRFRASTFALAASVMLAGCSDIVNLVTPAGDKDMRPARVAFTASVSSASSRATDEVSLRVISAYLQSNGTRVVIGTQTIVLSTSASQAVPIPVDLATCLSDGLRDGANTDAGCSVVLELSLIVNGAQVDKQSVGPLRLSAGATTTVSQPVTLFEIATIDLTPASLLTLATGASTNLNALVRDSRGQTVTGRTIVWASDAASIASVDAVGKVTGVGAGDTRVTASIGAVSSSIAVHVNKPAVSLVITAAAIGSGTGSVRSTPAGIDCRVSATSVSGACASDFAADAQVTLTSTADAGQSFGVWGGACVGNAVGVNCTVTMAQARAVSAQFLAMRRFSVIPSGSDGRGRVTGSFGIDCRLDGSNISGTCAVDVADGSSLTLTSTPDAASGGSIAQVFLGWAGVCGGSVGNSCTVVVTGGNRTATASFQDGKTLTVTTDGAGGGSVTSNTGIACSRAAGSTTGVCSQSTSFGATVTLTAQPDAVSDFAGWSGACSGSSATCVVTLSESQTASASFQRRSTRISITLAGSGNGTVKLNGSVVCARTAAQQGDVNCFTDVPIGTTVSMAATAGANTDFLGNSGDCVGYTDCSFVMNSSKTFISRFATKPNVTLTVEGLRNGSGVVRSTEETPLIDCTISNGQATAGKCAASVPMGTSVTLRAVGSISNALGAWAGECASATTYECTMVVSGNIRAVAAFVPGIDVEMRVSGSARGSITFTPDASPSQAPCAFDSVGSTTSCRFSLPSASASGVFRGVSSGAGARFDGFIGPCAESTSAAPVPVCTYRGIGFLRVFTSTFTIP